jgi:hypothetical protein
MSSAAEDQQVSHSKASEIAMNRLAERLFAQFPDLAPAEILRAVRGEYDETPNVPRARSGPDPRHSLDRGRSHRPRPHRA